MKIKQRLILEAKDHTRTEGRRNVNGELAGQCSVLFTIISSCPPADVAITVRFGSLVYFD